jgi:hypothetical protein
MVRAAEVIEERVGERVSLCGGDGSFDGLSGAWERHIFRCRCLDIQVRGPTNSKSCSGHRLVYRCKSHPVFIYEVAGFSHFQTAI